MIRRFQCSSASRKFLNSATRRTRRRTRPFQCSSASRKFLNFATPSYVRRVCYVSVLFSEPKIPQCRPELSRKNCIRAFQCSSASRKFLNTRVDADHTAFAPRFSALQRAENSSMFRAWLVIRRVVRFSALQRAENSSIGQERRAARVNVCFSALQRAENSSIEKPPIPIRTAKPFQCSSASRKFLN